MTPITIAENEFMTVQYIPDKKMIFHTVHKPITNDNALKDALNAGTDALIQYGVCKWLSDDRKNGPLSQEMVEWGLNDWDRRTIAGGWKYWANVVPDDVASAGTLLPVIEILFEMGLRMMVFTTLEDAMRWLDSMPS